MMGKQPSQVGDVYDRLVSFQVWSICIKACYDRPASASRQDGNSIG